MDWPGLLGALVAGRDLTSGEAAAAMGEILEGRATPAQIAGLLVGLGAKGVTAEELGGMLAAMLARAEGVPVEDGLRWRLVDTCGTGGDRQCTINVSTLAALVVAGAGVPVCKHGNRAASSACGSADLLEALGVVIDLGPEGVARCIAEAGIGFCFAPRFYPAMRHAAPVRRELGIPTVFNVLGPMANPARVRRQVIGVADPALAETVLEVLAAAGATRALVVHGHDGLDELTTTTTSTVMELRDGTVRVYAVEPAELGLRTATLSELRGGDPGENAAVARRVLDGERGAHRDIVVANAAAGLVVAGLADTLAEGVEVAAAAIDDGRAAAALERLVAASKAAAA